MEACFKKANVKLELLTDIDMVLMFEKGLRGGIYQALRRYAVANNKYMPNYNSQQISSYLMYLDANNLYRWAMCKKLPLNGFLWAKNFDKYTSDFTKSYNEDSNMGQLLELDVSYSKHLHELHRGLPFLPVKEKNLLTTLEDKKKICSAHICIKAGAQSWIRIRKSTQNNHV